MASVNDIFYADGSVVLLQSTDDVPTIFYADGSIYVVHEYVPLITGGWAHKFNGVTSPGKVLGVANASIGKICGVAA